MRKIISFAIFTSQYLLGCDPVEPLIPGQHCGEVCAIDAEGEIAIGNLAFNYTCNVGQVNCEVVDEEMIVTCKGSIPFSEEICDTDNVDEDCNEENNDIEYTSFDYRNTCEGVGECAYQKQICSADGDFICIPTSVFFGAEVCDEEFRDEDCDGLVNEQDPDLQRGEFSYSGPPSTANVGVCRAGVTRCQRGSTQFFGEVLPSEEICGNGLDDDCDGLTDEDEQDTEPDSFLLSIDVSGSMETYIQEVAIALCEWSDNPEFANSLFAIQAVGTFTFEEPYVGIVTPFVSAADACIALADYVDSDNLSGGFEFVPLAIRANNDQETDVYIPWPRESERKVIFFSDEPPQSMTGTIEEDIQLTVEDCAVNNYQVSGFVLYDFSMWANMTDPCGGWLESLTPNANSLREALDRRFTSTCH
jgi:hypothetical protein